MNRNLIIIIAAVLIAGLFAVGGMLLLRPTTSAPAENPQLINPTGFEDQPYYTGPSGENVPQDMRTTNAVLSAYQKEAPLMDNIRGRNAAIVGVYALVSWSGDISGGEALLKYDTAKNRWGVLDSTGGAYSVAGLNKLGVPQRTVLALLAALGDTPF